MPLPAPSLLPPRPLVSADLEAAARIERQNFSDPWPLAAFRDTLARGDVLGLALDDGEGRLTGYGLCVRAADEGEILNLAVDQHFRRSGAGRALALAMLAWLKEHGVARVYLEVRRSNLAAIGLYRSLGFTQLGARPAYYTRPREDALTMGLNVTQNTA